MPPGKCDAVGKLPVPLPAAWPIADAFCIVMPEAVVAGAPVIIKTDTFAHGQFLPILVYRPAFQALNARPQLLQAGQILPRVPVRPDLDHLQQPGHRPRPGRGDDPDGQGEAARCAADRLSPALSQRPGQLLIIICVQDRHMVYQTSAAPAAAP